MAKGKFKVKTYKVPNEKHVIVINPWGDERVGNLPKPPVFNVIGAWFELMLKDQLRLGDPGALAIYWQGTHRNLIVELHSYIDVVGCLGRHDHARYVHGNESNEFALIYEYNYEVHGDPAEHNWTFGAPKYTPGHIPPGFPIKHPYPPALPAPEFPPQDVRWAKKLTFEQMEIIQERYLNEPDPPEPEPVASTSSSSAVVLDVSRDPRRRAQQELQLSAAEDFLRGLLPQAEPEREVGLVKGDPYEEAEVPNESLRPQVPAKPEPGLAVKNELQDLHEERKPDLRRSMTLQTPEPTPSRDGGVKSELEDVKVKRDREIEDYEPSKDLIKAIASLPPEALRNSDHSRSSSANASIKNENGHSSIKIEGAYEPSNELMKAFMSLSGTPLHANELAALKYERRSEGNSSFVKREENADLSPVPGSEDRSRGSSSVVSPFVKREENAHSSPIPGSEDRSRGSSAFVPSSPFVKREENTYSSPISGSEDRSRESSAFVKDEMQHQPSDDLLKAFSLLPPEVIQPPAEIEQPHSDVRVKPEPGAVESNLSRDPRRRSIYPETHHSSSGVKPEPEFEDKSHLGRIKPELNSDKSHLSDYPRKRSASADRLERVVKSEPGLPESQLSRDPRKRSMTPSSMGNEVPSKKIKTESSK